MFRPPIIGIVLAFAFARDLDILAAGEEVASSLGMEVERAKRILLVNSALLTGSAVALSGALDARSGLRGLERGEHFAQDHQVLARADHQDSDP